MRPFRGAFEFDFYPRPPRGGRRSYAYVAQYVNKFLSTPSARRATCDRRFRCKSTTKFLSTPSARRATAFIVSLTSCRRLFLSTPSARRATEHQQQRHKRRCISIHALREEGDANCPAFLVRSTDFYPRPPRGGRPVTELDEHVVGGISIHALREEGDVGRYRPGRHHRQISIHALREEGDVFVIDFVHVVVISIHALREEGDLL